MSDPTPRNDEIIGTPLDDRLSGFDGDDILRGGRGNDVFFEGYVRWFGKPLGPEVIPLPGDRRHLRFRARLGQGV